MPQEHTPAPERPSLYDRLGGVYNIATVVDDLIDRVMTDARLNANPQVDEAHHRVRVALAVMAKDLTTALALAERTGTPTVLGAPTLEAARAALEALGPDADHTALARWLEDRVGEELRPAPQARRPRIAAG